MKTDTQVISYTWKPDVIAGRFTGIFRRLAFAFLDIKQIYRFWREGYRVRLTLRGWYVDFSKRGKQ